MEDSLISIISHITSTPVEEIYTNPLPTLIASGYATIGAGLFSAYLLVEGYNRIVSPAVDRIREFYRSSNS